MFDFEDEQFRVRKGTAKLPGACGTHDLAQDLAHITVLLVLW